MFVVLLMALPLSAQTPAVTTASAGATTTVPMSNSPEKLAGRGLAQHPFLYCGEWNFNEPEQTMWIIRDGKVAWSYSIPFHIPFNGKADDFQELGDCTQLSNGNIVFATRRGASEVTPDKKIVWHRDTPPDTELHSIEPLGLDRVLIAQNGNLPDGPAKIMIINTKTGVTEKEFGIPVGNPKNIHPQIRRVRITPAGTFLVAHMDWNKVAEYDDHGKELWSCATPEPWAAVRLPNGNTLVTGNHAGYVRELSSKCETVWNFDRSDMPGYVIGYIQDVQRLANGNTVFSNWTASLLKPEDWHTSVQLFELTPEKKIVWALRQWADPNLGPASGLQMLDQPGVPEKQGQLR
jgi:hypothetical protein